MAGTIKSLFYRDSSDSREDTEDKFGNLQLSDIDPRSGRKILIGMKQKFSLNGPTNITYPLQENVHKMDLNSTSNEV